MEDALTSARTAGPAGRPISYLTSDGALSCTDVNVTVPSADRERGGTISAAPIGNATRPPCATLIVWRTESLDRPAASDGRIGRQPSASASTTLNAPLITISPNAHSHRLCIPQTSVAGTTPRLAAGALTPINICTIADSIVRDIKNIIAGEAQARRWLFANAGIISSSSTGQTEFSGPRFLSGTHRKVAPAGVPGS